MKKLSPKRKLLVAVLATTAIVMFITGRPSSSKQPVAPAVTVAADSSQDTAAKPFETFTVYKDKPSFNHYAASGYMPVGKCVEVNDAWIEKCQWGKSCIKVTFDGACAVKHMGWAGVYWLDPANNWGDVKGGYNLTGAQQLTFWARGEKGGEVINFKIGGTGMNRKFADSDAAGVGPLSLSKEWREYSINLKGKNLSRIIGGFAFVANGKDNPEGAEFYIDEIYYK